MGNFRFESLLKLRTAERDEKKSAFLDAERRRQDASETLDALDKELTRSQDASRRAREAPTLDPAELLRFQAVRIQLTEKRKETLALLQRLTDEVEAKRLELNVAIKEVKILQNLKKKNQERRIVEERRRSEKKLDDLATQQKNLERRREVE
ncbi:MAG: flagellar FliJ family protein [Thermoguttaceae bacterium]|jgi:flagellar export protein FliJ